MKIIFTIVGPPRTKKTSNRIVWAGKFPKVLPSQAYLEWNKSAQLQLAVNGAVRIQEGQTDTCLPYEFPVNCRALFYRETNIGDSCGFYQALADCIQDAGILTNDRLVESWDGSRLLVDKANPRIEVELEPITQGG